jgi:hypothetical protein
MPSPPNDHPIQRSTELVIRLRDIGSPRQDGHWCVPPVSAWVPTAVPASYAVKGPSLRRLLSTLQHSREPIEPAPPVTTARMAALSPRSGRPIWRPTRSVSEGTRADAMFIFTYRECARSRRRMDEADPPSERFIASSA